MSACWRAKSCFLLFPIVFFIVLIIHCWPSKNRLLKNSCPPLAMCYTSTTIMLVKWDYTYRLEITSADFAVVQKYCWNYKHHANSHLWIFSSTKLDNCTIYLVNVFNEMLPYNYYYYPVTRTAPWREPSSQGVSQISPNPGSALRSATIGGWAPSWRSLIYKYIVR